MQKDPKKRASVQELLQHPFVSAKMNTKECEEAFEDVIKAKLKIKTPTFEDLF